jgi:SAM-dependent methyltransferase
VLQLLKRRLGQSTFDPADATGYAEHYRRLLAKHYSWMSGPFFAKLRTEKMRVEKLAGEGRKLAVDLGCGPGYQAFALAELGFRRVLAVDTSEHLLGELTEHVGQWPIEPVLADMLHISDFVDPGSADCITCMGDTLTHLERHEDVTSLIHTARIALAPGGALVISFRDLIAEQEGSERFFLVRASNMRILTCFLDFQDSDHVLVHDIVHQRDGESWTMETSAYRKLRLCPEWVAQQATAAGLEGVTLSREPGGWIVLSARR